GRGYVVRRLIRRAVRHSRLLGSEASITGPVVAATLDRMAEHYPHLEQKRAPIERVTDDEEAQFGRTLDAGTELLEVELDTLKDHGETVLPGDTAFRLFDTFGFPLPLTEEIAAGQGVEVDTAGFEQRMAEQRERGRAAQQFQQWEGTTLPAVEVTFEGYASTLIDSAEVLWLEQDGEPVATAEAGAPAMVVLDRTPFYAEGGGQVADRGAITGPNGHFSVRDVQRPAGEVSVHIGDVAEGYLAVGERVSAQVDHERRADTARNHSATHLLHAALRAELGEHVQQSGSLVAPDRLRFDFSHRQALGPEEQREIERRVNAAIRANVPVEPSLMPLQEALAGGALALFDERYGEEARVVQIGDLSRELCGGTHATQTGDIGSFTLTSEGSIGSGLRRVEAVTGAAAEALAGNTRATLETLSRTLGVPLPEVVGRVQQLQEELAEARRQLAAASRQSDQSGLESALKDAVAVNGTHVLATEVPAADMRALRETGDWLRDHLPGPATLILGTTQPERPQLVVVVPRELVDKGLHAGALLREVADAMGARGGGRPDMAQGGGGDPSRLAAALARGRERATAILRSGGTS
ncbi:MAG: alanine--tRNA ligase, partial [Dehalococcoidia bacterium]|nr:alanine--tRNA ligase [Dehalococcoidia bacterium]